MNNFNNVTLKPDDVYQVFLIIFESDNVFRYLDALDKIGEYKLVCFNSANDNLKQTQLAYVNTNKSIDELSSIVESVKVEGDSFAVTGMTLDMMIALDDEDAKEWCFKRQEVNMRQIIENTQQENLSQFDKFLDEVEKELMKEEWKGESK